MAASAASSQSAPPVWYSRWMASSPGVSIQPRLSVFTRIRSRDTAYATLRVMAINAPFDTA